MRSLSENPPNNIVISMLSTDLLDDNDYNANELTEEQLKEYRAEVRRLGRLPKPVVVRKKGDRYEIVEGAHSDSVAKDLHMSKVPCEVIEADDFEAILQNYKRNQHGARNPIKQGRAFKRLQEARQLSNRKLAKDLGISEATLRTYLDYVKAFDLRNGCAPNTAEADIAALSVKQVRRYIRLPKGYRDAWLDAGAVLARAKPQTEQARDADGSEEGGNATTNATTDDEEQTNSSQEGEQRGQEHEAEATEASDARNGREQAETTDDVTDNFDDVLQALESAANITSRFEEPLTRLWASHESSDAQCASEPVVNGNEDKKQANGSPSAILGPDGRLELPMVKNASQEPRYVTLEQWEKLGTEERRRILEEANGTSQFNRQGKKKSIEWALWSWNPVTGCKHNCPYCYARDTANRIYETKFNPTLWPDRPERKGQSSKAGAPEVQERDQERRAFKSPDSRRQRDTVAD